MSVNIKTTDGLQKIASNVTITHSNWNETDTSKNSCILNKPSTLTTMEEINANTNEEALAGATAVKELNSSLIIKEYTSTLSAVEISANGNGIVTVNIPDASEYIANGYVGYVMSAFLFDSSVVSNPISPHVGATDGNISIAYINNYSRTSGSPKVTIAWKKL